MHVQGVRSALETRSSEADAREGALAAQLQSVQGQVRVLEAREEGGALQSDELEAVVGPLMRQIESLTGDLRAQQSGAAVVEKELRSGNEDLQRQVWCRGALEGLHEGRGGAVGVVRVHGVETSLAASPGRVAHPTRAGQRHNLP